MLKQNVVYVALVSDNNLISLKKGLFDDLLKEVSQELELVSKNGTAAIITEDYTQGRLIYNVCDYELGRTVKAIFTPVDLVNEDIGVDDYLSIHKIVDISRENDDSLDEETLHRLFSDEITYYSTNDFNADESNLSHSYLITVDGVASNVFVDDTGGFIDVVKVLSEEFEIPQVKQKLLSKIQNKFSGYIQDVNFDDQNAYNSAELFFTELQDARPYKRIANSIVDAYKKAYAAEYFKSEFVLGDFEDEMVSLVSDIEDGDDIGSGLFIYEDSNSVKRLVELLEEWV